MSLDNIIGVRATQDAIRFYDPSNENSAKLPITRHLLVTVRNSHAVCRLQRKRQELDKKQAKEAAVCLQIGTEKTDCIQGGIAVAR